MLLRVLVAVNLVLLGVIAGLTAAWIKDASGGSLAEVAAYAAGAFIGTMTVGLGLWMALVMTSDDSSRP
ncbi:hypothetical protein ACTOB_006867 [Actinoplanes oblitus]|uniref:Uncharacterized protein n=1 Tax=Actinoplanes oblitus TaxID=3040509 RepID=A0ABY8WEA4_9ACTN|nr:hypothetical protein [Actinoplanes oblitus]WIM94813.1 hypothetical protein ACTOB_006867 [Actinoplanes oblitus]